MVRPKQSRSVYSLTLAVPAPERTGVEPPEILPSGNDPWSWSGRRSGLGFPQPGGDRPEV